MAAAGHYGHQSHELIKHYSKDLGLKYLVASTKDEVFNLAQEFTSIENISRPIILEIFTNSELETEALHIIRNLKTNKGTLVENKIRKTIGKKGVEVVKKIIRR